MGQRFSYAQINCRLAVDHMAASPKTLRQRIGAAYLGHLSKLQPNQVPEEAKADLVTLRSKLTRVPSRFPAEGSVEATLSNMHWKELQACAQIIVELSHKLDRAYNGEVL